MNNLKGRKTERDYNNIRYNPIELNRIKEQLLSKFSTRLKHKIDLPKIQFSKKREELSKIRSLIKLQDEPVHEAKETKKPRIFSETRLPTHDETMERIFPDILTSNRKLHRNIDIGKFRGRDELFGNTPDCIPDYNPDHNIRFKHPHNAIKSLYSLDENPANEKSRNFVKAMMRNTSNNLFTRRSFKNFFSINDIISNKKDDREREVMDEQDLNMIENHLYSIN